MVMLYRLDYRLMGRQVCAECEGRAEFVVKRGTRGRGRFLCVCCLMAWIRSECDS